MKKLFILRTVVLFAGLMSFKKTEPLFKVPKGWPVPEYDFKANPLDAKKIEIGRQLFYDPILSKDSTISCNSCHSQYTAFAHTDHALSHGIAGRIGTRNAPALMNLAWNKSFMWDGSVGHIDVQARTPLSNPLEMDEQMEHVVSKLQANSHYAALFYEAFGDPVIKEEYVLKSVSQFMLTLVSANAKYDKVKRGEEQFTAREAHGYQIFQKNCSACHAEPLFTNQQFENNGLAVDTELHDIGKMKVSQLPADSLKFKVPSLRNIELSYPYMHDGRFRNLNQVLNNYIMGIQYSPTLNPRLQKGIYLTTAEKADLVAFLMTLTDKEFCNNPQFSFLKNNLTAAKDSVAATVK